MISTTTIRRRTPALPIAAFAIAAAALSACSAGQLRIHNFSAYSLSLSGPSGAHTLAVSGGPLTTPREVTAARSPKSSGPVARSAAE